MKDLIENGVYFITDCYGNNYSMLYKDSKFIEFKNKNVISLNKMKESWDNDYLIHCEFVDTLGYFVNV